MRSIKKLASVLLALVLVFSLGFTALADGETYTITITNEKSGHIYEAYQIFAGTLSDEGETLSDIVWGNGVKYDDLIAALKTASEDSNSALYGLFPSTDANDDPITYTAAMIAEIVADLVDDSAEAQEFAQIVSENLDTAAGNSTETASPYTISGLAAGYYLVKDQDGSVTADGDAYTDIILKVVGNVTVVVKAEYPTVEKEVDTDSASIGDTVTFTITGTIPDTSAYTSYTYIFTDTLSESLTFGEIKSVQYGTIVSGEFTSEGDLPTAGVAGADDPIYTLVENGQELTITINNAKALSQKAVVITYTATLNANAVIGGDGNTNTVVLEYSNNPNDDGTGVTTTETSKVFTFELDVTKVDGDSYDAGSYTKMLEGAEFRLYYVEATDDPPAETIYYAQVDADGKVTGWTTDETDTSIVLTTDADGKISVVGLATGTYFLEETKAPDGYNKLSDPIEVTIEATYIDNDGDGAYDTVGTLKITVNGEESSSVDLESVGMDVVNNSGSNLPSTGGIGTTIFYIVGGILVFGAVVLLITRKRMKNSAQ